MSRHVKNMKYEHNVTVTELLLKENCLFYDLIVVDVGSRVLLFMYIS